MFFVQQPLKGLHGFGTSSFGLVIELWYLEGVEVA
jgi:hypothetical protein